MKRVYRMVLTGLGVLLPVLVFVPASSAQCVVVPGVHRAPASLFLRPGRTALLPVAFGAEEDNWRRHRDASIVGFWHFQLISKGSKGVKDGTVVDEGLAQWHGDFTEIQNSGQRPPSTGNFCLGVWEQTGERTYKLNHFPLAWDPTGTTYLGPANLLMTVTLSSNGQAYSGPFTLTQYDPTGKANLGEVQGITTAKRINIDSKPEEIF